MPRLAVVIAGARECWSLLSGSRSWWSSTSRRCRKPLALACLLLLSRRELLRPLLVLLGRPVLLLLGRLEARTSVAAGNNGDNLPLLVLHF